MNATMIAPPHRVGAIPTDRSKLQPSPANSRRTQPDRFDPRLKELQKKLLALDPKDFIGIVGVKMQVVHQLIPLVVNGIAFWEFSSLDWKSATRAKGFDMHQERGCLLARMTGHDFNDACQQMGLDRNIDGVRLGIFLPGHVSTTENFQVLTQLWIHAAELDQN